MATDFLQQLKLRQLFENQPQFGGQVNRGAPMFEPPEITIPQDAPVTQVPKTPFMDEYRRLLLSAPDRSNYQLGKWGKLGALGAGVLTGATEGVGRGIMTGRDITERPYREAVEDYTGKLGRTGALAELEHRTTKEEREYGLDIAKLTLDQFKLGSDIQLNDARARELLNRIKTSGKRLEKNELTGKLEIVDITDGSRMSVGQFAETPEAKRTAEHKMFKQRFDIEQGGRERLENIRFRNDKDLTKLRAQLDKENQISATQNNAAFEGAYQEAVFYNPGLASKLFDKDDKGNLVLKDKYDPKDYQTFTAKVNQRMNAKLGKEYNEVNFPTSDEIPSTPNNVTDNAGVPQVNDPLRQTAIQFLRDNNFEEDEASIQEAMKQLQNAAPKEPFVNTPVQPTGRHGLLRNQGQRENFFQTPWKVDPSKVGPLFQNPYAGKAREMWLDSPVRRALVPGAF